MGERDSVRTAVGVLDKCVDLLWAVRSGAGTISATAARAGVSRPTAHRLLGALVAHGLLSRAADGTLSPGPGLAALAASGEVGVLLACAAPVLADLSRATQASAQLFRRSGNVRVCIAAEEPPSGLKDAVPVGTALSMSAGSAAKVLLAWPARQPGTEEAAEGGGVAPFSAEALAAVRAAGFAASVGEREIGLASVSAPVFSGGVAVAALCLAGPAERLLPELAERLPVLVVTAARALSERLAAFADAAP